MSMMPLRAVSLVITVAFALTGSGCSLAFVQRAPDPVLAPTYPISCTDAKAAPVLDAICAGYFVANGLAWAASNDTANKGTGIGVSVALLALCGLSAVNGFQNTSRCEQVKSLNAQCITGDEAACRTLRPGWMPPQRLPAPPLPAAPQASAQAPVQAPAPAPAPVQPMAPTP